MSVRLRLLSLGGSSCSDADLGTSASTRCVQHCSHRHWTTPFPTSQHVRSASLETFRAREHECARKGMTVQEGILAERNRFADFEIALYSKGNAHSLICWSPCTFSIPWRMLLSGRFRISLRSALPRFRSACCCCHVAPTWRSTVLSARDSYLFGALATATHCDVHGSVLNARRQGAGTNATRNPEDVSRGDSLQSLSCCRWRVCCTSAHKFVTLMDTLQGVPLAL